MADRRTDDDPVSPGSDGGRDDTSPHSGSPSDHSGPASPPAGKPDEPPGGTPTRETGRGHSTQAEDGGSVPARPNVRSVGEAFDALQRAVYSVGLWRAVVGIAVVAVVARLVALGARPMHYDEARVGYWVLHYGDSGAFTYRHGIHGPLVQHADRWLFALVGASDFAARLPVALAGGLLPLGALLLREHLRKGETVALALFLAFNSVLLYYSRFMRSDVLLAASMFVAFGFLVRFYDTREVRYLYGVAVAAAFGFAAKENALVYVLTWLGATALLVDQALYRPRTYRSGLAVLSARLADARAAGRRLLPYVGHAAAALGVFLLVLVFMYADRGAGMAGITRPPAPPGEGAVGFWEALANPLGFPGYAFETLAGATDEALRWGGRTGVGESESFLDTYVSNLGVDLGTLASNAPVLLGFAVLGFVWERYGRGVSRNLVLFAGYCGFVSVVGYPLADDIGSAHWLHVHLLVPLAIPAAVAVAGLYRWGRDASVDRDTLATAAATFLLVLAALQVGLIAGSDVYADTTSRDNALVQYAQPERDFRTAADAIDRITAAGGTGTDVVVYTGADFSGDRPIVGPPGADNHSFVLRPACTKSAWYNAIPLHWYLTKADADVACSTDPDALASLATEREPPMIVTRETDETVPVGRLEEAYVGRSFDVYQWGHRFTVYLHEDRVGDVPGWRTAGDDPPS